jgi:hypothetical protein
MKVREIERKAAKSKRNYTVGNYQIELVAGEWPFQWPGVAAKVNKTKGHVSSDSPGTNQNRVRVKK